MWMVDDDENIHEIPRSVKCKNREKFQKKKKITQNSIYVVICLHSQSCRNFTILREKIQDAAIQFSLSKAT